MYVLLFQVGKPNFTLLALLFTVSTATSPVSLEFQIQKNSLKWHSKMILMPFEIFRNPAFQMSIARWILEFHMEAFGDSLNACNQKGFKENIFPFWLQWIWDCGSYWSDESFLAPDHTAWIRWGPNRTQHRMIWLENSMLGMTMGQVKQEFLS